jgi:RNA polymerase sigma-70 factor (ECF subfamily)
MTDASLTPPSTGPDLGDLISRSAAGDIAAFMDFYDATSGSVYGGALRVLGTPASAEAATQAVYVRLWETSANFDPTRCTVRSWILVAALHAVLTQRKSRCR